MEKNRLFRGYDEKRGMWHMGGVFQWSLDKEAMTFIIVAPDKAEDPLSFFEVNPDTVGAYIGRKDLGGRPVFEGDKVICHGKEKGKNGLQYKDIVIVNLSNPAAMEIVLSADKILITDNIHDRKGEEEDEYHVY